MSHDENTARHSFSSQREYNPIQRVAEESRPRPHSTTGFRGNRGRRPRRGGMRGQRGRGVGAIRRPQRGTMGRARRMRRRPRVPGRRGSIRGRLTTSALVKKTQEEEKVNPESSSSRILPQEPQRGTMRNRARRMRRGVVRRPTRRPPMRRGTGSIRGGRGTSTPQVNMTVVEIKKNRIVKEDLNADESMKPPETSSNIGKRQLPQNPLQRPKLLSTKPLPRKHPIRKPTKRPLPPPKAVSSVHPIKKLPQPIQPQQQVQRKLPSRMSQRTQEPLRKPVEDDDEEEDTFVLQKMNEHVDTVQVPFKDPLRWEKPVHAGMMTMKGGKRYFILTHDGRLWYFKNQKKKQPMNANDVIYISDMKFWAIKGKKPKPHSIKIERYPTPFYFSGKSQAEKFQWIDKLKQVGGIKCEMEMKLSKSYIKNLPDISKKDVKNWNANNVKQWLEYHMFGNDTPFTIYQKQLGKVTGKTLELLTDKDLKDHGISKLVHRKKLLRAMRDIRSKRVFNYGEYIVFKKIEEMTKNCGKKVSGNWKFLAKSLSDPETMTETYLNPSILEDNMMKHIGKHEEDDVDEEEEEVEGEKSKNDIVGEMEIVEEKCQIKDIPKEKLVLPIKLVVTEMVRSKKSRTARRLLSPVLSKIPSLSKEFGIFHTALIIGPWYLEWTDSSLVIPRKLYSGMALVSADIEASVTLNNMSFQEISERLSQTICRWNTTKKYKNMTVNKSKGDTGNCQDFVEDVMEVMMITIEKEGAFGKFLQNMKKKGSCELLFSPSKKFMETFNLSLTKYRFDAHRELDEFMLQCGKEDEIALRFDFAPELKLLKSFDRAFWLRHFKYPADERFKPSPIKCPFDDPRKTKSYIVYS